MHNPQPTINLQLIPSTTTMMPPPLVFIDRASIFADTIHDLVSLAFSFFQSPPKEKAAPQSRASQSEGKEDWLMSREEVKSVMEKLELYCNEEGDDEIDECFGREEVRGMFEENEPSLEELKQTFNVFDRNRDGFIDAHELHTVLGLLVSNNTIFIHDCKSMIARFDRNNDEKIDFNEFVKFMEVSLS
ncbi:probable calcium-binding protein CML30 [Cucurbita maxima]|uniref:Probable calcium-binding protein CML30 n=1 Tax=Cucurbita maxima TaxID=3661 RepID=A0A6J1J5Q6_CUCMA|nr:probable calcium-binding protein CML30 [Cucurbita maxima]